MAVILLGALASDVRGSVGGAVFQRSAHGLVLKAKTSPVNPRSTSQAGNRAAMFDLQSRWMNLTTGQRKMWSQWALYQNLTTGKLTTSQMSGQMAYVQVNRYRLLTTKTVIDDPIFTPYSLPASSALVESSGATMRITFPAMVDGNAYVPVVFMSFSVPLSRNSRPSDVRFILCDEVTSDNIWTITAPYLAAFGSLVNLEDQIWLEFGFQQADNGCLSVFTSQMVIVEDL